MIWNAYNILHQRKCVTEYVTCYGVSVLVLSAFQDFLKKNTLTQNETYNDDNEKPSTVWDKPYIAVLFFT